MKFLTHALCLLAIIWSPLIKAQQTPYYDIEIVLFKYNTPEQFDKEQWKANWRLPDIANSHELLQKPTSQAKPIAPVLNASYLDGSSNALPRKSGFRRLAYSSYKLKSEAQKLKDSSRYTVLRHFAWRQPGLKANRSAAVRIRAGQAYEVQALGNNQAQVAYEIDGTIKVVLGRYLHVYTDLLHTKAVNQVIKEKINVDSNDGTPEKVIYETVLSTPEQAGSTLYGFNVKQHRRMRSKKLHHIDHPLIGMLVYATRVGK